MEQKPIPAVLFLVVLLALAVTYGIFFGFGTSDEYQQDAEIELWDEERGHHLENF